MSDESNPIPHRGRKLLVVVVAIAILIAIAILLNLQGAFRRAPKVAIVTSSTDPYWDILEQGAKDAAREFDADVTVVRGNLDADAQSQKLKELVDQGVRNIGVSPINAAAQAPALNAVAERGVLVTFDSDAEESKRQLFIGTDNYAAGNLCAQEVRAAMPDGGEVLICVGSVEKSNGRQRRQGLIDGLLNRSFDRGRAMDPLDAELKGNVYTVSTLIDGIDHAKAAELAAEAIKSRPNLKCMVGLYGYNVPAILKALDQTGKAGQIVVAGFDAAPETQAGVEAGTVFATIVQDQWMCGYETVRILADAGRTGRATGPLPGRQAHHLAVLILRKDTLDALRAEKRIQLTRAK